MNARKPMADARRGSIEPRAWAPTPTHPIEVRMSVASPRGTTANCLLAALAFVPLLAMPAAVQGQRDPTSTLPLQTTRNVRFTTDQGTWMSVDVSPDGSTILFDLLGDLYTVPIAGGKATRI